MEKSIASLGDTLTRFIQGQKRPNSGASGRQGHCSKSRHRDHYSYYRRSRSRSPQIFNKSSRHYYGYQHGGWSPSSELSLNASQSEIDDEHEECSQYKDENEENEQQQGDGNHEDVGDLLTQNQQTALSVPPPMRANSAESDLLSQINSENLIPDNVGPAISGQLAEVAKRYWVEESWKVPVVAKIAERLKMRSNCNFAKVPKLNEKIANSKKILPYHKWADKRLAEIQKSVSLATSAILQMSNAALQYQQQPFEAEMCVSLGIDAMTVRENMPADISWKER